MNISSYQTSEVTLPSEGLTVDEDKIRFSANGKLQNAPFTVVKKDEAEGVSSSNLKKIPHPGPQIEEFANLSRNTYLKSKVNETDAQKSKILLGLSASYEVISELLKKGEKFTSTFDNAHLAKECFEEAISLLENSSKEELLKGKQKQAEFLSYAGHALLCGIEEKLKSTSGFNEKVEIYFNTAGDYYKKASEAIAETKFTEGLYQFKAGAVYEELAKEELKPLPESAAAQQCSSEIKHYFLLEASSYTGAFMMAEAGFKKEEAELVSIAKTYAALVKEYQKPILNEAEIRSLKEKLKNPPEIIQTVLGLMNKQVEKALVPPLETA